jgi:hypothetical protein
MVKKLVILLTLFPITSSYCEDIDHKWVLIDSSETVFKYIDIASISKNGNIVDVWEKWEYNNGPYTKTLSLISYDCKNNKTKILESMNVLKSGEISPYQLSLDGNWSNLIPETPRWPLARKICKFK